MRDTRTARGRLALNPQTQEPSQPVLASVEASTLTISVLVWHSHEFVDRGVYLESAPNLHKFEGSRAFVTGMPPPVVRMRFPVYICK